MKDLCSKNSIWERDTLHPRQSNQDSQSRAEVCVVRRGGKMPTWEQEAER